MPKFSREWAKFFSKKLSKNKIPPHLYAEKARGVPKLFYISRYSLYRFIVKIICINSFYVIGEIPFVCFLDSVIATVVNYAIFSTK